VPRENKWHDLQDQLSNDLRVLAERAGFDTYNDPDASLVPLANVGRLHLVRGMIQSAAGIPQVQYHLAGCRRIWIAVAPIHRQKFFQSLPSKSSLFMVTRCSFRSDTVPRCFWRHGNLFFRPDFLRNFDIPFTVCLQNPGDVVLIGGSTLYESYDEGPNVILSVPFLDQQAQDTITEERLVSSDTCDCATASARNRVVEKRARVLRGSGSDGSSDMLFQSSSPLTDIPDGDDDAMDTFEPSSVPSVAMDGPCAKSFSSMEPHGVLVLQGTPIYRLDFTAEHR
jgi:JmjC domain, hydroxylase